MFRTQANPMDDLVVKATDENLTSENWEFILDVCDKVSASPSGPAHAVSSLIKRLAHRNANVQLYTLELANALSQNCGVDLHRELASKAFTDALLRLAGDRNTHAQVKQKVLERMGTWADEFRKRPELGIMEQAFQKLRQSQPSLMPPPSKPRKQEISTEDRKKEDDELQMALALSVQDKGGSSGDVSGGGSGAAKGTVRDDSEPQPAQGAAAGTTAATVSRVRALYDFTPSEPGELAFRKNDVIAVLESVYKDWWKGSLRGQTGIFPLNYVEKLQDPTKEELERDAGMEAEVFGEIRNVEKLLALLSVREGGSRRGEREEEEISELYQRTLSIRPKLIELIGKYSQKKDDFTQLNEKFIKARRDYEALLDSSMSQPQYGQQQYPIRQQSNPSYPPPHLQQTPYGQQPPPQGYPPQGPPSAGYPPQQTPYGPQSHPHLAQPTQDPSQRFYSPAPSEPPSQQQPPQPYGGPQYPPPRQQQTPIGVPSHPTGAPVGPSAPFHFIPGGVQGGGPPSQQQPPPQQQEIRRKPSPANTLQAATSSQQQPPPQPSAAAPAPSSDPYAIPPTSAGPGGPPPVSAGSATGNFQGQIRPNSIHTLNSGNPQELATGGYESPVDNRRASSYHPHQHQQPPSQHMGYGGYAAQPQQQYGGSGEFDSPGSVYSGAEASYPTGYGGQPQQQHQQQPSQQGGSAGYQAYNPGAVAGAGGGSGSGGADPGDFYR